MGRNATKYWKKLQIQPHDFFLARRGIDAAWTHRRSLFTTKATAPTPRRPTRSVDVRPALSRGVEGWETMASCSGFLARSRTLKCWIAALWFVVGVVLLTRSYYKIGTAVYHLDRPSSSERAYPSQYLASTHFPSVMVSHYQPIHSTKCSQYCPKLFLKDISGMIEYTNG
ncbi:uncharacterized protein BDZ99DRAFT_33475 [Mytilinidion resinicola]|uniref:Uncharacterized protein n=1 Tax=Mytilinidion resinicola TaxID=574789 RepID=A0A6A6YL90_9PEZI|nr:uncharacterized protein BDZ99DRAFT_33475 [Mytilinidion resinicola]KAF2809646.1 hypothetical protein BDZ99DRAFT_33475 [Mytilinidion resinicola]